MKILPAGLLGVLIMGMLSFGMKTDGSGKTIQTGETAQTALTMQAVGIIIPHHMIVSAKIDSLLKDLAKDYEFENVIILSPNHFNYGFHYIQTASDDLDSMKINGAAVARLNAGQSAFIENKDFKKEHGVMSEIPLIKKYWPAAQLIPIIIKNTAQPFRLNALADELSKMETGSTLIIASLDFSHYCTEETAKKNDQRFLDWMASHNASAAPEAPDASAAHSVAGAINLDEILNLARSLPDVSKDAIALDSAEAFYVFWKLKTALNLNAYTFVSRTSSAEITGLTDPMQNTSHIFALFKNK